LKKQKSNSKIKCKNPKKKLQCKVLLLAPSLYPAQPTQASLNSIYAASPIVQVSSSNLESLSRVRKSAADGETSLPVQRFLREGLEVFLWVGDAGDHGNAIFEDCACNVLEISSELQASDVQSSINFQVGVGVGLSEAD